jgi:hypothetical protein
MVVHNGGRIYKEFDKYDKFKIVYREEDHQLYLEYNDIVKMFLILWIELLGLFHKVNEK